MNETPADINRNFEPFTKVFDLIEIQTKAYASALSLEDREMYLRASLRTLAVGLSAVGDAAKKMSTLLVGLANARDGKSGRDGRDYQDY